MVKTNNQKFADHLMTTVHGDSVCESSTATLAAAYFNDGEFEFSAAVIVHNVTNNYSGARSITAKIIDLDSGQSLTDEVYIWRGADDTVEKALAYAAAKIGFSVESIPGQ